MTTHVRPTVEHHVSSSGYDYGIDLKLERFNEYGNRASGLAVGELSRADLAAIAAEIIRYLGANPSD